MYELISTLAEKLGKPYARKLAYASVYFSGSLNAGGVLPQNDRKLMNLGFPSPLGLAAGFDKRGAVFEALHGLGFGFGEIGSVTPLAEPGRSPGLAAVALHLSRIKLPRPIPLGVSISSNRASPPALIPMDYINCMKGVWDGADYITINLGVRGSTDLYAPEYRSLLHKVLSIVKAEQDQLAATSGHRLPLLVKIDQARGNAEVLAACVRDYGFDGLILCESAEAREHPALYLLERLANASGQALPIISVGGIRSPQDAEDRLNAGASLLQLYTGLVKHGPLLVGRINRYLAQSNRESLIA